MIRVPSKAPLLPVLFLAVLLSSDLFAQEDLASSALAGARSEGLQGRKYAPDRPIDLLHLKLDITPDFTTQSISGVATLRLSPLNKPVQLLVLDAVDLTIERIEGSPGIQETFISNDSLEVTFSRSLQPGEEAEVVIIYRAEPKKGLYFRTPEQGYAAGDMHLWTQGETHEARFWYPSFDYPNERFTSEVICRVPSGMIARSNGALVGSETDSDGLVAWHWLQDKPHTNYLVALVAGHLTGIEDRYGELELGFWTVPSQAELAARSFNETREMMAFFEEEIGMPYPWARYDQVAVLDFLYGGMENTTLTILTDRTLQPDEVENTRESTGLVAHELAHQWFGNYVTCEDWSHAWLNEGFATYYAALYRRHREGSDSFRYRLWEAGRSITGKKNDVLPTVHRGYEHGFEQFSYRAYQKGAWVLHMLRAELGEEAFRDGVLLYLNRHALGSVVTSDLVRALEEVSGASLDSFFDQWVYHAGTPELAVQYHWDASARLIRLQVRQTQKVSEDVLLFHVPLKVRFFFEDEVEERVVELVDKQEEFYFGFERQPSRIQLDPDGELLASIRFNPGHAMWISQLREAGDGFSRALACAELSSFPARDVIQALEEALTNDDFYGARIEAARALSRIGEQAAIDALIGGMDQDDARVRLAVVEALGGLFDAEVKDRLSERSQREPNPVIRAAAVRALGKYPDDEIRDLLRSAIGESSYREEIALAAIQAARMQQASSLVPAVLEFLSSRSGALPARSHGSALANLGFLSRDLESKEEVREFLIYRLDSPQERVVAGALEGLGELGEPAALGAVEAFAGIEQPDTIRASARKSAKALRSQKVAESELQDVRDELMTLKDESEAINDRLERLEKQLDAQGNSIPPRKKRRGFPWIF